jgi:hypothetical protein
VSRNALSELLNERPGISPGSAIKDFHLAGLVNSSSDAFRIARACRSRTKRRLSLILTSLSKTASAAVFTSNDKSAGTECDRGQAHRIKRVDGESARSTRARNGG